MQLEVTIKLRGNVLALRSRTLCRRAGREMTEAAAFTLLEIVMVLALVALLTGTLGFALSGRGSTHALQHAQSLVSTQLVAARSLASLTRQNVRLLIHTENRSEDLEERQLRFMQVVSLSPDGSWRCRDDGVYLPRGVCLVPKITPTTLPGEAWVDGTLSQINGEVALEVTDGGRRRVVKVYYVEFTPLGNTTVATLVLSPAVRESTGADLAVTFTEPRNLRGIKLSQYGAQTLLPSIESF